MKNSGSVAIHSSLPQHLPLFPPILLFSFFMISPAFSFSQDLASSSSSFHAKSQRLRSREASRIALLCESFATAPPSKIKAKSVRAATSLSDLVYVFECVFDCFDCWCTSTRYERFFFFSDELSS